MERISKINYYLDIAETVASRSTCLRKKYGAIIVKNDIIIATGFCGAPRGRENCCDRGTCIREELNIPRGERYELCRSVHAEANAMLAASREQMLGAVLYQACVDPKTGEIIAPIDSCQMCKKLIINAGISQVINRDTKTEYRITDVASWVTNDDSLGTIGY
ncbi:MAG: deaminase [Oscillospiraceae bacterium]|nr:deaminase [Oscillospiraceae bacterium]